LKLFGVFSISHGGHDVRNRELQNLNLNPFFSLFFQGVLENRDIMYDETKIELSELAPDLAIIFDMCVSNLTVTDTLGKGTEFFLSKFLFPIIFLNQTDFFAGF
jgi:hypothetical protein